MSSLLRAAEYNVNTLTYRRAVLCATQLNTIKHLNDLEPFSVTLPNRFTSKSLYDTNNV